MDIDLYPWDSGTDSGISYMSPNAETQPRERMHKITTKYPEDPRAPFYNVHSDAMIPLAKLYIRREKVVTRNCDEEILQSQIVDVDENDDEANNIRKLIWECAWVWGKFVDKCLSSEACKGVM
jgi:spondin-1